jgi:hypothetical protein
MWSKTSIWKDFFYIAQHICNRLNAPGSDSFFVLIMGDSMSVLMYEFLSTMLIKAHKLRGIERSDWHQRRYVDLAWL